MFRHRVVKRALLTLRNTARSINYRADRHRIYVPSNNRCSEEMRRREEAERNALERLAENRKLLRGSIRNFVLLAIVMKKKGASYGNREGTIGPAVGGA